MHRRDFYKTSSALGFGLLTGKSTLIAEMDKVPEPGYYNEEAKKLPAREFDVVVVGGGTAGVICAIAASREGARTVLVENKGYVGGVAVEGGTALHSFYNLWKAFPGVKKRQLVRGIPAEMVDRLTAIGGATGYAEMEKHYDYDSVCTAIDTELYKLNAHEMLDEAGVYVCVNTLLAGAVVDGSRVKGVILESRSGREVIFAKSFVDCTGYADLAAYAGAKYTEPNDYAVVNSMGLGNVNIERYYKFLADRDAIHQLAYGMRSGEPDKIIRIGGEGAAGYFEGFRKGAYEIGMSAISTTTQDNYLMFIKMNMKLDKSPTDHRAHMSTRNTASCMGQGQASGTAAALCALNDYDSRTLPYKKLRKALEKGGVYFEN